MDRRVDMTMLNKLDAIYRRLDQMDFMINEIVKQLDRLDPQEHELILPPITSDPLEEDRLAREFGYTQIE